MARIWTRCGPVVEIQTYREAVGVYGLITPWNFPIAIPAWKMAPGAGLREYRRPQARQSHTRHRACAGFHSA